MGDLSVDELLDELQKRMQESPDTKLKTPAFTYRGKKKPCRPNAAALRKKAKINGQAIFLRTGEYSDDTLGEIFIDWPKEGSTLRS
jgi:ribonucleoside-diphosphate reductase alpha chain